MTGMRANRVAARVQQELATLLRSLSDPRLQGIFVSRVEMTDDLQVAKVYVRHEQAGQLSPAAQKSLLRGFDAASSRLRKEVSRAVALRRAPELRFLYDAGQDSAHRVEEILREIRTDGESQSGKSGS